MWSNPILLDSAAVALNGVWRFLTSPVDFSMGAVTILTPVGLILEPIGLTKPIIGRG